jgi:hypothetical protein
MRSGAIVAYLGELTHVSPLKSRKLEITAPLKNLSTEKGDYKKQIQPNRVSLTKQPQ